MSNSTLTKRAYTSLACEKCRLKHRKCDGNKQCRNCMKSGSDCIYLEHRKRDPPQGNKETLVKKVMELESRVETLQTQVNVEQSCNLTVMANQEQPSNILDLPLQVFSVGNEYFQYYRTFVSFSNVDDPTLDFTTLYQPESTICSNAFIYSMMSIAALKVGNNDHAIEFHNNAMSIVRETYSMPHSHMAATHMLLSEWFSRKGDICRSKMYKKLACNICNTVLARDSSDPSALATYTIFMITRIGRKNNIEDNNELARIIEQKNVNWSNREFAKWVSGSITIWNNIFSQDFNLFSLEEWLLHIDQMYVNIPDRIPENWRITLEASISAFKSFAYRIHGKRDLALHYSLDASKHLHSIASIIINNPGHALLPISLTCQIFKSLGRMDLFQDNLQLIQNISAIFPFTAKIIAYLTEADAEPSPYWFMNEFMCSPRFKSSLERAQIMENTDDTQKQLL